jgi:hypothetical protein
MSIILDMIQWIMNGFSFLLLLHRFSEVYFGKSSICVTFISGWNKSVQALWLLRLLVGEA